MESTDVPELGGTASAVDGPPPEPSSTMNAEQPNSAGTVPSRTLSGRRNNLGMFENNQHFLLDTGLLFECLGDYERARLVYAQITRSLQLDDTTDRLTSLENDLIVQRAMVRLCLVELRRGKIQDTQRQLQLLVEACPRFRSGWLALAKTFLLTHQIPAAFAAYQRCLELDAESARDPLIWIGIGILYQLYGQLEEAWEAYKVAQRLLPVNYEFRDVILYYLATLKCASRDFDTALMLFSQALQYRAEERSASIAMNKRDKLPAGIPEADTAGRIPVPGGKPQPGVAERRATSFTTDTASLQGIEQGVNGMHNRGWPGDPPAHKMVLGMIHKEYAVYEHQRRFRARRAGLDLILDEDLSALSDGRTWCEMGHIYLLCQNAVEARKAFENALISDPADVDALQQLSWTLILSNEVPHALDHLRRCVQLDPTRAHSWYLLGRAYALTEQHMEACDAYQQAVLRDPNHASYWCSIGVLYYQTQQYADAADAYLRAIRLNPGLAEVWFDLGILYETYGQFTDACSAYHRAMSLNPHNNSYQERYRAVSTILQAGDTIRGAFPGSSSAAAGTTRLPSAPASKAYPERGMSQRNNTSMPTHRGFDSGVNPVAMSMTRLDATAVDQPTGREQHSVPQGSKAGLVSTNPSMPWTEPARGMPSAQAIAAAAPAGLSTSIGRLSIPTLPDVSQSILPNGASDNGISRSPNEFSNFEMRPTRPFAHSAGSIEHPPQGILSSFRQQEQSVVCSAEGRSSTQGHPGSSPAIQVVASPQPEQTSHTRALPKITLEPCPLENTLERNKRLIILPANKNRSSPPVLETSFPEADSKPTDHEALTNTAAVATQPRRMTPDSTDTEQSDGDSTS
ncbi:hypothetical protein CCYA_CCYA07G2114 [Cyanidiococcus yangmingshanensis]|nr:hypothetical protein CCYA_CCYA07G2114 [Cyanidiococcus yangmingshanensis]